MQPHEPIWLPALAPWPAGVQAGITYRHGGVSAPPWDSWNLGDHVGDQPEHVARNRQRLADHVGGRPVFCRQVHGIQVLPLFSNTPDGLEADGSYTHEAGVACTMMVADCLPLLLALPDGSGVAALHAGWRGLCGQSGLGVIEALCRQWPALSSAWVRQRTVVWVGPCIGPQAFEVGPEVRQAFCQHHPADAAHFTPCPAGAGGKWLANLPALARARLQRSGFECVYGNDASDAWCTVTQASRFFSHRRDQPRWGSTGRMGACIWRHAL